MAEISETKTPRAGEWWVRNSGGRIFFIVGLDPWGCVVHWNQDVGFFTSKMRFFCREHHHEPRCTGFGWVEPPTAIDPGDGYRLLPVGTMLERYDQVLASGMTGPSWMDTAYFGECVGSRRGLEGPYRRYRRKIKPVESPAEDPNDMPLNPVPVEPTAETWYVPRNPDPSQFTVLKRETARKGLQYGPQSTPLTFSWDGLCNSMVDDGRWIEVSKAEAMATIAAAAEAFPETDTMPLNPVPGKVVATGTVTLTPVESPDMAAIIAEHTQQVRELTQRIGELVQQVNERDGVIEKIRTALRQDYSV